MKKLAVLSVLAMGLCGCFAKEEKLFDPTALQNLYKERAVQNTTPRQPAYQAELDKTYLKAIQRAETQPATQPATLESLQPTKRMRLRELIQLAAANSLDVKVAGYQPAIDEARVTEAEARFDPSFIANFNFQNQWVLQPSVNNPFFGFNQRSNFETAGLQTGIKQTLPTGAQIQFTYQFQRTFQFGTSGPSHSFEGDIALQITQPLLQNAGTEVNRARIVVARNTQRVSVLDFRLALEKNLAEIEQGYWQLVQAEAELNAQQELLTATISLTKTLQKRFGQDVTAVDLGQANSALRARESSMVELRQRIREISNAIKRRVNDPEFSTAGIVTLMAQDKPIASPIAFNLVEQIDTALQNRAELAQQKIRIESARVVQSAAKNNLLPALNLVVSLGSKSADELAGRTLRDQFDFSFREYGIGLQFEVPLGNREARAIYRRTQLQQLQAIDQYKSLIEQVIQEVKDAHDNVYSAWERVVLTHQTTLSADFTLQRLLEQMGNKELDPNFIFRLLSAQETFAQAKRDEARAIADYNSAIAVLERAKGTLLRYDNVLMAEDPHVVPGPKMFPTKP